MQTQVQEYVNNTWIIVQEYVSITPQIYMPIIQRKENDTRHCVSKCSIDLYADTILLGVFSKCLNSSPK